MSTAILSTLRATAESDYRDLAVKMFGDDEPLESDIQAIVQAAGRSLADLESDVQKLRHRSNCIEALREADAGRADAADASAELNAAMRAKYDAEQAAAKAQQAVAVAVGEVVRAEDRARQLSQGQYAAEKQAANAFAASHDPKIRKEFDDLAAVKPASSGGRQEVCRSWREHIAKAKLWRLQFDAMTKGQAPINTAGEPMLLYPNWHVRSGHALDVEKIWFQLGESERAIEKIEAAETLATKNQKQLDREVAEWQSRQPAPPAPVAVAKLRAKLNAPTAIAWSTP